MGSVASVRVKIRPERPRRLGIAGHVESPFEPVEWRAGQKLVEAVWKLPAHKRFFNWLLRREHPAIEALDRLYRHYSEKGEFKKASDVKIIRDALADTVEGNRLLPAEDAQRLRMALMKFHETMKEALKKSPEKWPYERIWEHLRLIDSILSVMAEKRERGVT